MDIVRTLLIIIAVITFWGIPIFLGIRIAKKKNLSPHWMWVGVNPLLGWIAFAVLNELKPKKECINCGEKLKMHAKVCAYCNNPFDDITIPKTTKHTKSTKTKRIIVKILSGIGVLILFAFFMWTVISKSFIESWAYENAFRIAENNIELVHSIGKPIVQKGFVLGSINTSSDSGTADLIVPVKGTKGSGKLLVYAVKQNGTWKMKELVFENKEKNSLLC